MYILVKEYRIIFWVMQIFYHSCSKIDGLFYDDGDKKDASFSAYVHSKVKSSQ